MSQYAYDYNPKNESYLKTPIAVNTFYKWTKENLYRTSYITHWTDKPLEPKNVATPGYQGFIPGMTSNNEYGKSYSRISRECFSKPTLGQNKYKLSTTGFNSIKHDFLDPSSTAKSHKYGRQTIPQTHPSVHPEKILSETKEKFLNPKNSVAPTFRETDKFLINGRSITRNSGFLSNYQTIDGKGWVNAKVLDAERTHSEYRDVYNTQVPFHRNTQLNNLRKKKKVSF